MIVSYRSTRVSDLRAFTQAGRVTGFIRADDPKLFPDSQEYPLGEDSTSGPKCPDLEVLVSSMSFDAWGLDLTEPPFALHAIALRPTSLGALRLKSNGPFEAPEIDPRFVEGVVLHRRY